MDSSTADRTASAPLPPVARETVPAGGDRPPQGPPTALGSRPDHRERYLRRGPATLGDGELLGLVLGTGTRSASAIELGQGIVRRHGGLAALMRTPPAALLHEPGLGAARAVRLHAALELGRRAAAQGTRAHALVTGPADVVALLQPELAGQGVEELHGLYLGRRGQLLHRERLSRGSPANTIVHTGTVLRAALLVRASRLVLVHNHPSGDPQPSPEDLAVTRRVLDGGRLVGVELVDHIILAGSLWCSLAERGLLVQAHWPA